MKPKKKNYYLGLGIAIGLPIGIVFGIAIDNISVGPAIGMAFGVAIGLMMEKKYNKEPLEGDTQILPKNFTLLTLVLGAAVLLLGLAFLFYLLKN